MQRAQQIRVRTNEMMRQARSYQVSQNPTRVSWTDMDRDALNRIDTGIATRSIPMRPDFKYTHMDRPTVVADYLAHKQAFGNHIAAAMDFAQQLLQPTGTARTQNVLGAERFGNERVRSVLGFFTEIAQIALIGAYKNQLDEIFSEFNEQGKRRRTERGDPNSIVELYPELDVHVDMSCTPFVQYEELKQMWYDGIMSKEDFAHHVFHMKSLPDDQITISQWPDGVPRELLDIKTKPDQPSAAKKKK